MYLLKIGENNYVFLATHSCFMIDKKTKQRNFIIKKDNAKNTIHQQISEDSQVIDDEKHLVSIYTKIFLVHTNS